VGVSFFAFCGRYDFREMGHVLCEIREKCNYLRTLSFCIYVTLEFKKHCAKFRPQKFVEDCKQKTGLCFLPVIGC